MSYGQQYGQYGGNPYGGGETGGYGAQNPYGSTAQSGVYETAGYGSSNPYGGTQNQGRNAPPLSHQQASSYSQGSQYSAPVGGPPPPLPNQQPAVMSNQDFLTRIEAAKADIRDLTANISSIGTLHQRVLSSPDSSSSAQLENLVSQTQILNSRIRDQVKFLEADAARSGGNVTKDAQVRTLKQTFKSQLEQYQREEQTYRQRYQEQIARQYRIVNPDATEDEVREAANADWGDEGVFQTALKTNRSGYASSVLGAVRARHNDIQQIEATLIQLNQLFQDLAEAVLIQEPAVQAAEEQTEHVKQDTEAANVQLDKGIVHARRARKLKWWSFCIVLTIIVILGLVLGLYFGLRANNNNNNP